MTVRTSRLRDLLFLCAPMPALILGVITMRQMGVGRSAWSMNLAACGVGLLVFAVMTSSATLASRRAWYFVTIGSIAAILATFASHGLDGVHRWVFAGGFGLHPAAILTPLLITCVATAPSWRLAVATATATSIILALQPDAAQTCSFAAACGAILIHDPRLGPRARIAGLVALTACSIGSFVRLDPLEPVRHVEGIFEAVSARGPAWTVLATAVLFLLPAPYFFAWARNRQIVPLALGVYVAMVTIAPMWGTFPVPIMGAGVSPILGYFIALALGVKFGTGQS
jgi:cell division protein FtsW (lipid II flippase)